MAGGSRVDLRLPPGLIESARAAQYANREALGARELDAEIKAKVRSRVEAARRGGAIPSREGGQLEFKRKRGQRLWTKRRVLGTRVTYTIEGSRFYRPFDPIIGEGYTDQWTLSAEWNGIKKTWLHDSFSSIGKLAGEAWETPPKTALYISTFEDQQTGDELPPFIAFVLYNVPILNPAEPGFLLNIVAAVSVKAPFPFDNFPDEPLSLSYPSSALLYRPNLLATEYSPLHAWSPINNNVFYGATAAYLSTDEYNIPKIARAPNYVKTASAALTDEASYSVSVTVTP